MEFLLVFVVTGGIVWALISAASSARAREQHPGGCCGGGCGSSGANSPGCSSDSGGCDGGASD